MSSRLRAFYFHDARAFVIPVEHLGDRGMSRAFAAWLENERDVDSSWVAAFDEAFARYQTRARVLHELNPENWFPPRRQNVCVVMDAAQTRPFYQPFNKASWLVYASDFDPATSHVELATYLLFHTERLCLAQNPAAAVAHNLGYWLQRTDEEILSFERAARASVRPDASAFVALADALRWVRQLHHPTLRPLTQTPSEPVGQLPQSGLIAPASLQADLVALVGAFRESVGAVANTYFAQFAGASAAAELCAWLVDEQPSVLITQSDGEIVWDPAAPTHTERLLAALGNIAAAPAASMRLDIETADRCTTLFMRCIVDPTTLALPGDDIEQSGLTYIHAQRKLIAYNVHERGMNRTAEPAAPYERLMLAARTVHEWGHLAVDAGHVRVPEARRSEHARARLAVVDALQQIVDAAPAELDAVAAEELELTGASTLGAGLTDIVLGRVPDLLANMLARELLSTDEMETYLRQQVTSLVQENLGPFGQIARYAYEYQYLMLSAVDDPMDYFVASTWFADTFIDTGIVSRQHFEALINAMHNFCSGYEIDIAAIRLPQR